MEKQSLKYFGFSLIEIIITISILALMSSGTYIWFASYQRQAELDSGAKTIVTSLRDAQSRSISGNDFKEWGIFFDDTNNKFILFRDEGSGYAGASIKEENYLSSFIIFDSTSLAGGCNEIIFKKPKGNTNQTCSIKITDTNGNSFRNISVSSLGLISN
ncbi:MAG: prepilin-type N-terminal cleavage/methylation domain-containing protein [Patescibacteria group bacterium]|nr:prepilin-type N-terminal cleavage/methylation domain-containing protein [Patescibacteria group bacterium]